MSKQKCQHGRPRPRCRECKALGVGGGSICEHDRERWMCKECKALGIGGSQICEHDRVRFTCKECGGSRVCEHQKQRSHCRDCGGNQICEHNHQRGQCVDCGGVNICKHKRFLTRCSICNPVRVYETYRKNASNRGRTFSITIDEFISVISLPCFFCGDDIESRGIDRWNNKTGYEIGNCRPCCTRCNWFKGRQDGPTFIEHCQQIAEHTKTVEENDLFDEFIITVLAGRREERNGMA